MGSWCRFVLLACVCACAFALPLRSARGAPSDEVLGMRLAAALTQGLPLNATVRFSGGAQGIAVGAKQGDTFLRIRQVGTAPIVVGEIVRLETGVLVGTVNSPPAPVQIARLLEPTAASFQRGEGLTLSFGNNLRTGVFVDVGEGGPDRIVFFLTVGSGSLPTNTVVIGDASSHSARLAADSWTATADVLTSGASTALTVGTNPGLRLVLDRIGDRYRVGLDLNVFFAPMPTSGGAVVVPEEVMRVYECVFAEASRVLFDATEGQVYFRTVTFMNDPSTKEQAHVKVFPFASRRKQGANATPQGWAGGGVVELTLEQHVCQSGCAATEDGSGTPIRAAWQRVCDGETNPQLKALCEEAAKQLRDGLCRVGYRGATGIAHEMGHWLFGLADEYSGVLLVNCDTSEKACNACSIPPDRTTVAAEDVWFVPDRPQPTVPTPGVELGSPTGCAEPLPPGGTCEFKVLLGANSESVKFVVTPDTDRNPDLLSQLQTDKTTFAEAMRLEVQTEGGTVLDLPDFATAYPPKPDAPGYVIAGSAAVTYALSRPSPGEYTLRLISQSTRPLHLEIRKYVEYSCGFRCGHHSTNRTGTCEPLDPSTQPASLMDSGTRLVDRNQRREFCVGLDAAGPSRHQGAEEPPENLGNACWNVFFVNGQEYASRADSRKDIATVPGKSCWGTIDACKLVGILRDRLVADGRAGAAATLLRVPRDHATGLPMIPTRQDLPAVLEPTFRTLGEVALRVVTDQKPLAGAGGGTALSGPLTGRLRGVPAYVLCVDTSGSMLDAATLGCEAADPLDCPLKADLTLRAVRDAVSLMTPEERFGLLTFSDDVVTVQPLDSVAAAREPFLASVVDSSDLGFGDRTAIGDALVAADEAFRSVDQRLLTTRAIILVSDGRNNQGINVEDALARVGRNPQLAIHTVALGDDADVETLSRLARLTGGSFRFTRDARELAGILPRIVAEVRSEYEILDAPALTVGAAGEVRREVRVDAFVESATFLATSDAADDLEFDLLRPDGSLVAAGDPGVQFRSFESHRYYRVSDPQDGTWQLVVRQRLGAASPQTELGFLAFSSASTLAIHTVVRAQGELEIPHPIIVESVVAAPSPITDISVRMFVRQPGQDAVPDADVFQVEMRDDGSIESGDREAGDGIYTAIFADYVTPAPTGPGGQIVGGAGVYVIDVHAENIVTATSSGRLVPSGDGELFEPYVPQRRPFFITDVVQTFVGGRVSGNQPYTLLGTGSVLGDVGSTLAVRDLATTPILSLTLQAREEWQLLESMHLRVSVPREGAPGAPQPEFIQMVGLYLDADGDGRPDNRYRPIAWARMTAVGETATTREYEVQLEQIDPTDGTPAALWLVPSSRPWQLLVTLGQPQPEGIVPEPPPLEPGGTVPPTGLPPGVPLLGLVLLAVACLLGTHRLRAPAVLRQCTTAAFLTLLFLSAFAMGCGASGSDVPGTVYWFGSNGRPTPGVGTSTRVFRKGPFCSKTPAEAAGEYAWTLDAGNITVRGLRSGVATPLPVEGASLSKALELIADGPSCP